MPWRIFIESKSYYLSFVVSRYQVTVSHLSGRANILSDFASRNARLCIEPNCQICCFISRTEDSVVRSVSIHDVLNDEMRLPCTTRSAWGSIQSECADLRRAHAHLKQCTRPSKILTNIKDVKRYLSVASIAKDGLLVVRRCDPFVPPSELIIVPRSVLDGLVTALHIKLDHPSKHQLNLILKRYCYAVDMSKAVEQTCDSCHICASLKWPKRCSSGGPSPWFRSLQDDPFLKQFIISVEVGRVENPNKHPVAEKVIAEFEDELFSEEHGESPISELTLAVATARLNSRLRQKGLSSRELWTQRNQFTQEQLSISDMNVIRAQQESLNINHDFSETSKCRKPPRTVQDISVGDLVYLYSDKSKTQSWSRYLVASVDGEWCLINKLSGS